MNGIGQELRWGFDGWCTRIANEWTDAIGSSRRSNPNKTARVWSWNPLFLSVLLWRLVCFGVRFCGKEASVCCSNSNNGYSFGQARCRQEAYQEVQAHAAWPQNLCQGLFSLFFLAPPSPIFFSPFSPLLYFLSCASFHGKDVMLSSLYHLSEEEDEDEDVPALLLLAEGPCSLSSYFLVIIAIRFHLSRNYEGVLSTFDDSLFSVSLHLWFSGFHIYVPSVFFPPFLYSDEIWVPVLLRYFICRQTGEGPRVLIPGFAASSREQHWCPTLAMAPTRRLGMCCQVVSSSFWFIMSGTLTSSSCTTGKETFHGLVTLEIPTVLSNACQCQGLVWAHIYAVGP